MVKCSLRSWTIAGTLDGWLRLRLRTGTEVGCWRTGVPGTRVGSFREEWKDDQGVPVPGEPGILEEAAPSSAIVHWVPLELERYRIVNAAC